MERELEAVPLPKRILVRVMIVVALYPILLGGVANLQTRYRARWMQMRLEHREALNRDKARRGTQGTGYRVQGAGLGAGTAQRERGSGQ